MVWVSILGWDGGNYAYQPWVRAESPQGIVSIKSKL